MADHKHHRYSAAELEQRRAALPKPEYPEELPVSARRADIARAIALAVTSRPLNENERRLGVSQLEYARTPFVFAVSAKSAVRSITRIELAGIYSGRILKWPDGSAIRLVLRPPSDVDSEIVKSLTPALEQGLAAAEKRPGVQFSVVTDQDAAGDLERIPGAIGPSSLALILSERRALRALQLDGVEPTPSNAVAGAYPL